MIFATVGTALPFDRLVRAVDDLALHEEAHVQCGATSFRPVHATHVSFLPYEELVGLMLAARVVVAHAGVGSVVTALMNGRRPVVVPRLARYGEAVDDHQLHFARRLAAGGLVELVEDVSGLAAAVARAGDAPVAPATSSASLAGDLRAYLAEQVGRTPSAV